jgi:predicted amidohydrolase YtcJ
MSTVSRREFLESGVALTAVLGAGGSTRPFGITQQAQGPGPDMAVVNARVFTVDDDQPRAEAFALKHGRFIAVGSTDDIRNLVTRNTEVIDAGGMTVTPGFIDCHLHPGGTNELLNVNLSVPTIADIQAALRKKAAETLPNHWVEGFSYDDTKVVDANGRYRRITREDLDEAVPDRPVRVSHRGGHIAWFNSKAFEMAGITVDTPDPPGGQFYKRDGKLDGLVAELATRAFNGVGERAPVTREVRQAGVKLISEKMVASGLTTVHDGATSQNAIIAYQDAYAAGEMGFRMRMMVSGVGGTGALQGLKDAGISSGFGDDWLKVQGAKFSADGSASGRTMAMKTPYVGRPNDYGILTMTQEELHEAVEDAHRHGFQIQIHANGDRAIEMVLNAYERVQRLWPHPDPRHRIEHCTLVNPDILRRLRDAHVIPDAFSNYVHFHGNKWAEYGEEKMRWMFAHRSFLDYGIPVAVGSDYLPGPFEPLMGIQSMVTRKDMNGRVWGANQKITLDEALRVSTMHGARGSYEENVIGSITAGKLADFVMLAEDPHEVDPDRIKEIKVARTVIGGRTMHEG